jgi:hypothetical protein
LVTLFKPRRCGEGSGSSIRLRPLSDALQRVGVNVGDGVAEQDSNLADLR